MAERRRFVLALEARGPNLPGNVSSDRSSTPEIPPSDGARRILMVDDNPDNLRVLSEALSEQDFELLVALGGEEALEVAAAAQPALILLDINMPGMDGFETCRRLKQDPGTREIVIIFLSARDSVQDKVEGLRLGAVDYISKPFEFEEVLARVNTQLELKLAREQLALMHAQAESLLHNILPESIAQRLRDGERSPVDRIDAATILFADLVGFTPMFSSRDPDELVEFLNRVFSLIDGLVAKHGLEKIKTVGDAYMVAGGVPETRPDHAEAVAACALELVDAMADITARDGRPVQLRIGIHSGPVVAGVIGEWKFAYDLWGDTVNTASRMEQSGEADRIQISAATRKLLGHQFTCESRGMREVKGKGAMETFFLTGCSG